MNTRLKLFYCLISVCWLNIFEKHQTNGALVNPIYEWINLEFNYSSLEARQEAISNGEFIEGSPKISDVDVYYTESNIRKVFVTIPRSAHGVPATLGLVTNKTYNSNPIIAPYPSWDWHKNLTSCPENRIVSVFRIMIDDCVKPRLWVMDSGFTLSSEKCPAQILAFDLNTNELIHRYEIPNGQIQSNSVLAVVVTDVRNPSGNCDDTFLYMGDTRGFAIVVYDVNNRLSWRIADKTMHAVPDFGILCIGGAQFELMDGIQGMALGPYEAGKDRALFYHALASNSEQSVWTSKLRNNTIDPNPDWFHIYCGRRDTQSSPMAVNKNGITFFGLASHMSMNCWKSSTPYSMQTIHEVYRNATTLQYINGLKIITNRERKEELWFANTRAGRIANGPTNENIVNFRVQKADVEDLIRNSKCEKAEDELILGKEVDVCHAQIRCSKCYDNLLSD